MNTPIPCRKCGKPMLLLHHSLGGDEPRLFCTFCQEKQPTNPTVTNEELHRWNQLRGK